MGRDRGIRRILVDRLCVPGKKRALRKIELLKLQIHMVRPDIYQISPSESFFRRSLDILKLLQIGEIPQLALVPR